MSDQIVSCTSLTKTFPSGNGVLTVLEGVSLSLGASETCAIVGPSGSGKSSLLALLAGLDQPTSGSVTLAGQLITGLSEEAIGRIRAQSVGFVFQNFQLLPGLTALENVQLPLEIQGKRVSSEAAELLKRVGLGQRSHHYPHQLSGGEQQRVALARAFVHKPAVLFADEPTGNLDPVNAQIVLEYLAEINRSYRTAVVLVTHDLSVAERMNRTIRLNGGRIVGSVE